MNNCWHVFGKDQIKPEIMGDELCVLAIPGGNLSVRRLGEKRLRHNRSASLAPDGEPFIFNHPAGIIFEGVSPRGLELLDAHISTLSECGFTVATQNKQTISKARELFLAGWSLPENIDCFTFSLIQGLTHLLPVFNEFRREPIIALSGQQSRESGILVVEDDELLLEVLRVILEAMGHKKIALARNGKEALALLEERGSEFDLMLLNLSMPEMDGLTLLGHLKYRQRHPLGVIMTSGYYDTKNKDDFFSLGTDFVLPVDYIEKPFLPEELVLEVSVALEYMRLESSLRAISKA
jgi:CheY-like chemotaxis protein